MDKRNWHQQSCWIGMLLGVAILFLNCSDKNPSKPVTPSNTPPVASFTITPSSGTTQTDFTFDASGCTDEQDATSALEVRWDWENDNVWDTDFTVTKTITHQYTTEGDKIIKLEVTDTGGLTNITTRQLSVTQSNTETGTVTDIDGNIYKTVKIGKQVWMAENLKVTHYKNGNAIPDVKSNSKWIELTTGACCAYNNTEELVTTYGRLYNGYAVTDTQGLAPKGWHIPTDMEWSELVNFLGGDSIASGKLKESGFSHWVQPNINANNTSGFSAFPGGGRSAFEGIYYGMGYDAEFWTSTSFWSSIANQEVIWTRILDTARQEVGKSYASKIDGHSVRCVQDD